MASVITEVGSQFMEKAFSGILWIGIAFIVLGVLGFVMYWFLIYKRKFNIKVKIISERANDKNRIIFDNAAILRDRKDGSHYFKLWKLGLELPSPKFSVLQSAGRFDYLELYRTSENTIYFLAPPTIDKKKVIGVDGHEYLIASQVSKQINPDMEFWAIKRKGMNKKMFDPEKLWMKVLMFLPQLMMGAISIFVLYILMSYLPEILRELSALAKTINPSRVVADVTTGLTWILN